MSVGSGWRGDLVIIHISTSNVIWEPFYGVFLKLWERENKKRIKHEKRVSLVGVVWEASNVDLALRVHSGSHGRCFEL